MPVFKFEGPNGRIVEMEGPEGSTREQALAEFQKVVRSIPTGRPAAPPPGESMQQEMAERGPWEQFAGGAGATTLETWYGLKDLFGQLTDQERKELEFLQGIAGGPATAGRVAGDVGLMTVPGTQGAKAGATVAGRVLPRAIASRRATPALGAATGEAAALGAFEAARTPGTTEERLQAGQEAATGALVGQAVGGAVTRGLQGLPRSARAQRSLDRGVPLTPGQAAPDTPMGRAVRGAESRMGYLPFMGPAAQRMQLKALGEENRALLQSALPRVRGAEGMTITAPGKKGFREAQDYFGTLYDDFWESAIEGTTPEGLQTLARHMDDIVKQRAGNELSDEAATRVTRYLHSRLQPITKTPTAQNLQKLNQDLRDYVLQARNRGDLGEADLMEDALAGLQGALGPNAGRELADINRGYARLKVLEKASSYQEAQKRGGIFNPDELTRAVKSMASPRTVASGRALMSQQAENLRETVGDLTGGTSRLSRAVSTPVMTGAAIYNPAITGTVLGTGRVLASEPVRRVLTGRYAPSDPLAQRLRNLSGIVGAASQ